MAPAHLIVGSLDPLLDDSNNLAAKLKDAGVPCDLTVYQGINHGFIRYGRLIGTAARAIADCAAALRGGCSRVREFRRRHYPLAALSQEGMRI